MPQQSTLSPCSCSPPAASSFLFTRPRHTALMHKLQSSSTLTAPRQAVPDCWICAWGEGAFDWLLECHFKQLALTEQHNKNSWASKTLETHKCPQLSSRSRASRNLPGSSETQPHRSHAHSNPSHAVSQGHQRYSLV